MLRHTTLLHLFGKRPKNASVPQTTDDLKPRLTQFGVDNTSRTVLFDDMKQAIPESNMFVATTQLLSANKQKKTLQSLEVSTFAKSKLDGPRFLRK